MALLAGCAKELVMSWLGAAPGAGCHCNTVSVHPFLGIWWCSDGIIKGKGLCFLPFSSGSCASTEFWDLSKCSTTQSKTYHQPVQTITRRVERARGKDESPTLTWGSELAWCWLWWFLHWGAISFGKSPRATAPAGVSDLARCKLRKTLLRWGQESHLELGFKASGFEVHSFSTSTEIQLFIRIHFNASKVKSAESPLSHWRKNTRILFHQLRNKPLLDVCYFPEEAAACSLNSVAPARAQSWGICTGHSLTVSSTNFFQVVYAHGMFQLPEPIKKEAFWSGL